MKSGLKKVVAAAAVAMASMGWAGVAAAAKSPSEPGTGILPTIELYMNQQGVLARQGTVAGVTVTGANYDAPFLFGDIGLRPNNDLPIGPNNPACPIFLSGTALGTSAPIGQNTVRVPVSFFIPPNTPPGTYNCALKYVAIYKSPFTGISYFVGKGNQVNVPYTVRRAF